MIIDHIENAAAYAGLGPRLEAALNYLKTQPFEDLEPGRYELDGDNIFALVQDYDTRGREGARSEAHRKYIDIQYVVRGRELLGYAHVHDLQAAPYDTDKDVLFLDGEPAFVTLRPGTFAILLPQDAHMPGIAADRPEPVRKVVVKVAVDERIDRKATA